MDDLQMPEPQQHQSLPSLSRLEGKIAIITGAASGIGHAAARLFAREGAVVIAVDRESSGITSAHPDFDRIFPLAQDVNDDGAAEATVEMAMRCGGGLDILFNNAGVSTVALAEDTLDEHWDHEFSVNSRSVFRFCRAAIPALRERAGKQGRARIINNASIMAERSDKGLCAYSASKHAVVGLSKTLALELGQYNITVNYLLPGSIRTEMTAKAFESVSLRRKWEEKSPLRRLGTPDDVARAALILASDETDFITGHGLVVDGGATLRA
ncbi:SDR family NAD(P)-dependent oxidoreductase [Variovorax ginsengisoli]|uniref:NAD(P)-dependent dehydrogenase (Short-subunit alcohol dehydrogenase family) n=1 Tax=Variovorax ginsengisoli TaxID=363844 RepID=A0ABT9SES7_9BURK|nr:SDR family NAD(P)-dependent oxidoreductase [Variovorax ginsengisoli]MDP9902863.1 NAD(P)-dependent dehydrogenase (short-subunit alcohol dehydrogenase family) [Variovorax ginsengisoli]